MDGGALLGAGTFGCVFDPPMRCSTNPNLRIADKVGKLGDIQDVVNELEASKILSGVPNSKEYFSLADSNTLCKFQNLVKDSEQLADIEKCKILCTTIETQGTSKMVYYNMPYGGVTIKKYFSTPQKMPKTLSVSPREIIIRFLEACATITLNNYVHFDIHNGNVLFDEKTRLPRIIDFGMSFSASAIDKKTLDDRWKQYKPNLSNFSLEAPEITIITGISRNNLSFSQALKDSLYKKYILREAQTLLGLSLQQQGRVFQDFWNNSKSVKNGDWVSFFRFYWTGFDAWGAGYVILNLYKIFATNSTYYSDSGWKTVEPNIKEVLRGLLQMSPSRRTDCVQALAIFEPENRVVLSASGKAWLEKKVF
jgi:serine/threonine protein kinase